MCIRDRYNPVQIAHDLKKNNGAIPGYRPGKPTSDFIHNSLSKVTLVGAIFLGSKNERGARAILRQMPGRRGGPRRRRRFI